MNRTPEACFEAALQDSIDLLPTLKSLAPTIGNITRAMIAAWNSGNKILFCGNGGSAADAMHYSEELVVRYHRDRKALAAIALLDPSAITCVGNDYGYDQIFSRQIDALARPGDVLVALTTSGNSANIIKALEIARSRGVVTVGFLGKDGGKAKSLCDLALVIPSQSTARIQEAQKMIYHSMCDYIDAWALGEV